MPAQKSPSQNRKRSKLRVEKAAVFLNIPYDRRFENLLLAYIAGISAFGFAPRATLEIPFSQRRLERIISLIASSQYSVHDLSRVQLDRTRPSTPRFNMPFKLGITVGIEIRELVGAPPFATRFATFCSTSGSTSLCTGWLSCVLGRVSRE